MRVPLLLLPLLAGCPGSTTQDTDDTSTGPGPGEFEHYIDVQAAPSGVLTCHTPGEDWLVQEVDEALQVVETHTYRVEDFEKETPVVDATVDIWLDDVAEGPPDASKQVDNSGLVSFDLPSCTPFSYRATTPPELGETIDTYEAHQVFPPLAANAGPIPYNSVSETTYRVIPGLLGVDVNPGDSIIAGTAYDCAGEPIEGAQVVVRDASGEIPEDLVVKYFIENFPNRDQLHTSADGLWVAINVPPGTATVQAWVSDGAGGHLLIGETVLTSYADSINISNITTGYGDGVVYPEACLASAE